MSWLEDVFHVRKPIIAMCHFERLPGDPGYDSAKGLDWVLSAAGRTCALSRTAGWTPSCSQTSQAFLT